MINTIDFRYIAVIFDTQHNNYNDKLWLDLQSRTPPNTPPVTPHTSPLRASYGISVAIYTKKNERDISIVHCTSVIS